MNKPSRITTLYISSYENALKEHDISRRVQALRRAGYVVTRFTISQQTTLNTYMTICRLALHHNTCFIHIEGNGITDKMTLIKLINPHLSITWDMRSVLPVTSDRGLIRRAYVYIRHTLKRYVLSFLVNDYRFTSPSQMTIPHLLAHKPMSVIQNSTLPNTVLTKKNSKAAQVIQKLVPPHNFTVICLSNPQSYNTALDILEKVARTIHKKDKNILFILIGEHPWHTTSWNKNILFINSLPDNLRSALLSQSNVGLALYADTFAQSYIDEPYELEAYARFRLPCVTSFPKHTIQYATPTQYISRTSVGELCSAIINMRDHTG